MPDSTHGWISRLLDQFGATWLLGLAVWGGISAYMDEIMRTGAPFRVFEAVMKGVVAGFAGSLSILVCAHLGWPIALTGAAVGVSGWAGSHAVNAIDDLIRRKTH